MSIQKILLKFKPEPDNLVPAIKEIQKRNKYLSRSDSEEIAEYFSLPRARVFETASFFDEIKTEKPEKTTVRVCSGGPCQMENSAKVAKQIELLLKTEIGSDAHPKYKLEYMSCRGICDRGPVLAVDEQVFERVEPETVDDIMRNYL